MFPSSFCFLLLSLSISIPYLSLLLCSASFVPYVLASTATRVAGSSLP